MNAATRELFRLALLRILAANDSRYGLAAATLVHFLPSEGFSSPHISDIQTELEYFEAKGFAHNPPKAMSAENQTWRITDAGRLLANR